MGRGGYAKLKRSGGIIHFRSPTSPTCGGANRRADGCNEEACHSNLGRISRLCRRAADAAGQSWTPAIAPPQDHCALQSSRLLDWPSGAREVMPAYQNGRGTLAVPGQFQLATPAAAAAERGKLESTSLLPCSILGREWWVDHPVNGDQSVRSGPTPQPHGRGAPWPGAQQ